MWKAERKSDGKVVAVKVTPFRHETAVMRERWRREWQAAEKVAHPNLIQTEEAGFAPDQSAGWLALEWIEGGCLRDRLLTEEKLSWQEMKSVLPRVCEAVGALHVGGVIHRDLKPTNLLFEKATGRVVVADLGMALPLDEERVTRSLEAVFSPGYTAPEQLRPESIPDPRSDQFSLAVTIWELLRAHPATTSWCRSCFSAKSCS